MALDSGLAALMVETVEIEWPTGTLTLDGIQSYGAAVEVSCHIEATNKKVFARTRTDPAYMERVATSRIYLAESPVVTINCRLTLPDGRQPLILAVAANGDERGAHHQVIRT